MARDPVCGMNVDEKKAAGKSEYKGNTYYFCAVVCKKAFDSNPEKYLKKQISGITKRATAITVALIHFTSIFP